MRKIKIWLLELLQENLKLRLLAKNIVFGFGRIKYFLYYLTNSIDENLIVFEVFNGRKYCDSPKAMYEYMLNNKKYNNYKFVWCFNNPDKYKFLLKNRNTMIVKNNTAQYYKTYAKAKYWIANSLIPIEMKPKKSQIFIQTWHGSPLKRIRCDIECNPYAKANTIFQNTKDAKRFNYFISPSAFTTEQYIRAFDLKRLKKDDIVIEKGYPRNDALFKYTQTDIKKLKKQFNLPSDKKVILYAPTFRDNQRQAGVGYTYKLGIDFEEFRKKFEKDYVILFRTHYFVTNSIDLNKYKGFIYDASEYDDINDLYIISDIILTDYSSVFFDYANLRRPMLFYMYDLEDYKYNMRDFYFDLDELPGPIIEKEKDLYDEIKNMDKYWQKYQKKYDKFNKKFNYLDDANASKRVVEEIFANNKQFNKGE